MSIAHSASGSKSVLALKAKRDLVPATLYGDVVSFTSTPPSVRQAEQRQKRYAAITAFSNVH
jgi:hypothetical protein